MITTAVHQASQMVEIQGAPAAAPASADDFRTTFSASVGGSVPQKTSQNSAQSASSTASSKQSVAVGTGAKTSSLAAGNTLQRALNLNAAGSDENAAASGPGLKANSDLALKNAATADAGIETADVAADAGAELAAQLRDEAQVNISELGAASLPVQVLAGALAKDVQAAKSSNAAEVRGRKEETSTASSKDTVSAQNKEISVAAPVIPPGTTTIGDASLTNAAFAVFVQACQVTTPEGASTAQEWTKTPVLTSALQTSEDVKITSGSAVIASSEGDPGLAAAGLNEIASLQLDISAAPFVAQVSKASGSSGKTAPGRESAGGIAGLNAKGDFQSDALAAAVQPAATASGAARSIAGSGAIAPLSGPATSTSAFTGSIANVKASTFATNAAAVTQVKTDAQLRSVTNTQSQIASRPAPSKTAGAAATQLEGTGAKDVAGAVPAGSVEVSSVPSAPAGAVPGEIKLMQQSAAVSDVPAVAVPLVDASSSTANTATVVAKDEKPKASAASSDDASSARSTAQTIAGDTSSSGANFAAAASNTSARPFPLADATVPIAANIAVSSSHSVAAAGPAVSVRALAAAPSAEPSSSVAQSGEPHRTLLATPTTLEVGVQSGTQGWLRIRAEVGGPGEVNASLSAASSGGRDLLHSQMPALNAFLHSEQLAVTATVADRAAAAAGGTALGSGGLGSGGLGTPMGSDASGGSNASLLQGGGAQSGGSHRETVQPANVSASDMVRSYDASSGVSDAAGALSGSTAISEESGRWLNVRV